MNDQSTISERAVNASNAHRYDMRQMELAVGTQGLDFAINAALTELGITSVEGDAGEKGTRTGRYSTLGKCLAELVPTLRKHGVRVRQGVDRSYGADDGAGKTRIYDVFTDLKHLPSGEVERTIMPVPCARLNDPQSAGAALTYGRRYGLLAALGLTGGETDDNARAARPRNLEDNEKDSAILLTLKKELSEVTDYEKLITWRAVPKNSKRVDNLDEAEFERLKAHWSACKDALESEQ